MTSPADRAAGALYGLAIGDALGMPTQALPRAEIVARYGPLIGRFEAGPADHPLAAGLPAGSVTDDTEQAVLVGRLLADSGGRPDGTELARQLIAWEDGIRARGSLDLLGPSTRQAIAALLAGAPPGQAGRHGTTNGAAMRITPVGIATPAADPDLLTDRVVAVSEVTHNTGVALAGAAAVAAAVSAAIDGPAARRASAGSGSDSDSSAHGGSADGLSFAGSSADGHSAAGHRPDTSSGPAAEAEIRRVTRVAVRAARRAGQRGYWVAAADVAARIEWATAMTAGLGTADVLDVVYRLVGTSLATQESVPAAFAVLAASPGDPWLACRIAASLGGDCDTIAAMTGAIAGACHGVGAFPGSARQTIDEVNGLDLGSLAARLLALRDSSRASGRGRR